MSTIEQLEERIRRLEYGMKWLKSQRDYSFSPMNDTLKIDHILKSVTEGYLFVPLTTPLTSTSWDGDARTTTARTIIDLSAVFSAPAGIKAALMRMYCRDSASAGDDSLYFELSATLAGNPAIQLRLGGLPNDFYAMASGICPCDANGDIYFALAASGAGTMDCMIEIHGYWI